METALDIAYKRGHEGVINYLKNWRMNPERLPYESRTQSANRRLNGSYGNNYEKIIFKIKNEIEAELPTSVKETLNTYVMSYSSGPKVESVQHFFLQVRQ